MGQWEDKNPFWELRVGDYRLWCVPWGAKHHTEGYCGIQRRVGKKWVLVWEAILPASQLAEQTRECEQALTGILLATPEGSWLLKSAHK